jgi:hypothetical protein
MILSSVGMPCSSLDVLNLALYIYFCVRASVSRVSAVRSTQYYDMCHVSHHDVPIKLNWSHSAETIKWALRRQSITQQLPGYFK